MSVRLRLQRKGAKHMAFYRIVAADQRSPRDGRFIEQLGYYDPLRDPPEIKIDTPKVIDWLSKGAQPTDTVESLLRRVGVMQMWHEVKNGKPIEQLAHIEEEARKRLEARASMDRRRKEEARAKKAEKPAEDTQDEAESTPEKAAPEAPAEKPAAAEEAGSETNDAAQDSDGGASQDEAKEEAPAGSESGGDDAPAESKQEKPE